ncbi:MAG: hypothetical protein M3419_10040 [Actinomycetota bacterium]|nr:hypothetical protein [Actinomycetota bacterium]
MRPGQPVFLHVGGMKTGTSFVQQVLRDNADALREDGAAFAGRGWADQVAGVRDVLQLRGANAPERDTSGAWQRLVDGMGRSEAAQVISMEFLSFTGPARAAHVVESLAPADVHVVLSVRDAGRVIPAQWQEHTQNRGGQSWRQWCEAVADTGTPKPPASKGILQALRVPRMVRSWGQTVRPGRFHVVTVPPSGSPPDELWRRFAEALSLSAERYRLPTTGTNVSLGHVSAELMRRLNGRVQDLQVSDYNRVVKAVLGKQVLAARTGEPKVVLPSMLAEHAADWDHRSTRAIRASSAHVIGDLDDLTLRTPTDPQVVHVGDVALLEAVRDANQALASIAAEQGLDLGPWHDTSSRRAPSNGDALAHAFGDLELSVRALAAAGRNR